MWPVIPEFWRVSDAPARIRALLLHHPGGAELAFVLPPMAADETNRPLTARAAVASTLTVGLELARDASLTLDQDALLGPVVIRYAAMGLQWAE